MAHFTTGSTQLRALVASLAIACTPVATAQSLPCAQDPERHAQLAEQDTVQLFELQARHGQHAVSDRTRTVFARLVRALREADPRSPWIDWRLRAYGASFANAHAMHTGTVVITRGLDDAAMPEDALAASLAHEMGHVLLRHGIEQACFTLQAVNPSLALRQAQAEVSAEGWSSELELGKRMRALSQRHELQADAWAVTLLARAGFAPDAMSQLFAYLAEKQPTAAGLTAGSHPSTAARAQQARQAEAMLRSVSLKASATPAP